MNTSGPRAHLKPSPLRPGLAEMAREIVESVESAAGAPRQRTLAMFDMAESTAQKLRLGQQQAIVSIIGHNLLCKRLTEAHGGKVLKELGDGILCSFENPVDACVTGLNIKAASGYLPGVETRGAITTGTVQELAVSGASDALGEPVDRCARVISLALASQILIDQATRDSALAWLADYTGVELEGPFEIELKGCGVVRLFELSLIDNVIGDLRVPFRIDPTGRLAVTEKDRFFRAVKERVVELGTGLTTFAAYLEGSRPAEREFTRHIVDALKRGVNIACYALNPDSSIALHYVRDRGEPGYLEDITSALRGLTRWKEAFASGLAGSFEVRVYDHFPYLHAMCIDPELDSARIIISHYLYATRRADTPYMELGRQENPALFDKWWGSIQKLVANAPEWKEQQ